MKLELLPKLIKLKAARKIYLVKIVTNLGSPRISLAATEAEIIRCFPVMQELRPHLSSSNFVEQIGRQQQAGYQIAYLECDRQIKALAGFKISENLAFGKFLYIDDLVTCVQAQSQGFGGALFDWLAEYARSNACEQLHLDSGVQRFAAHRFYMKKGLHISSHHFSIAFQ